MAYTALTCEEQQQSVETLLARAMVVKDDGSWAFQTVAATSTGFFLTSGSITDDYYLSETEYEGFPWFVRVGYDASVESVFWSVIRANDAVALGSTWCITDGDASPIYYSTDDVDDPRNCTTWIASGGSNPLPVFT